MKRNIFQKQDDSEIEETTENKVVSEINVDSEVENTTKSAPSGLTDIINLVNINQVYDEHNPPNIVFKDFNFDIKDIKERGQFITIMGKSGCGKSTLLLHFRLTSSNLWRCIYIWEKTNRKRSDPYGISAIYFLRMENCLTECCSPLNIERDR